MTEKKKQQLGMSHGTASNRLVKDLLFKLAVASGHVCYRCGGTLTRDTFSIEHKKAWLDTDTPVELFFDLENVAFSHRLCNYGAARKPGKTWDTETERKAKHAANNRNYWHKFPVEQRQQIRREKYKKYGV